MGGTWVLKSHASQALGIDPGALNLPRSEYGFDADALWVDPRFREVVRQRDAIARQLAEHRFNLQPHLQHKAPPTDEEARLEKRKARKAARNARRKARRAAAASVV
jgi:hypothetical protein